MEENPDETIAKAKAYITQFGAYRYGRPIQDLMDLVSGVNNYKMLPTTDQGFIYHKLIRRMEHNHVVDIDMMISKFWYGAIQAILKAQPIGTEVDTRYEGGRRKTNMSPLSYIRNHGVGAARKYIDECCRRKLKQLCHDCGCITSLGKQRELDPGCKCGHKESKLRYMFVRHPVRICLGCNARRSPTFERICGILNTDKDTGEQWVSNGCGSSNIEIIQTEDFIDEDTTDAWEWKFGINDTTPEVSALLYEAAAEAEEFASACLAALPPDPHSADGDSQTRKVLRIIINPTAGIDICEKCRTNDNDTCGAISFDIDSCVNYSRKLGQYFGYSAALANRRVKKVREHAVRFAIENMHKYTVARFIVAKLIETNSPLITGVLPSPIYTNKILGRTSM
jgi:hypothetical protein